MLYYAYFVFFTHIPTQCFMDINKPPKSEFAEIEGESAILRMRYQEPQPAAL